MWIILSSLKISYLWYKQTNCGAHLDWRGGKNLVFSTNTTCPVVIITFPEQLFLRVTTFTCPPSPHHHLSCPSWHMYIHVGMALGLRPTFGLLCTPWLESYFHMCPFFFFNLFWNNICVLQLAYLICLFRIFAIIIG